MTNKIIYIDISTNKVVNVDGGITTSKPQIIYGSSPYIEFHITQDAQPVDLTEATAWQVSIDTDFDLTTDPMTRSIGDAIDPSSSDEGIIIAHINTNTQKFQNIVNGKDSVGAQLEIRGFDGNGDTIYCIRFAINCWGAVDLQALSSVPIPDNIASKSYVTAITSGFQSQINNLNASFAEVVDVVEDLSGTVEELAYLPSDVEELSGKVETVELNLSTLSGNTSMLPSQVTEISGKVDTNISNISTLSTTVTTHTGNITFLSAAIDNIQPAGIEQLRTDINTVSGNLNNVSTTVNDHIANSLTHVSTSDRASWNAKSNFSGNYNDLTNRPDLAVYETKLSAAAAYEELSGKIEEVSGKLPTSNPGVPLTYVTSSYSYVSGDAGKLFFIDEEDNVSFSADGYAVSDYYEHTLSGQCLYAALSGQVAVPGTTTKVNDLLEYDQPASGVTIVGTFDGVSRTFIYHGTYLNSHFNTRLPIWKDTGSNYYLYGARNSGNLPAWCVTTYLPPDNSDPNEEGLYYATPKFGAGSLKHPMNDEFNNSDWSYSDGPYSRPVAASVVGSYPENDIIKDVVFTSISGSYSANNIEMTVGSGVLRYTDVMEQQQVSLSHYTATWSDSNSTVYVGMGYSDGTEGNMPGTYIKVQITSNGNTTTYGKFGSVPLSGGSIYTMWPTALYGEFRDLSRITEWEWMEYEGPAVTLYNVKGDRKGYITTTTPLRYRTTLHFAQIPLIHPTHLIF